MAIHGASSSFGKEVGLIHEVLVTGRKTGADHDFWAALAHDEALFAKLVGVYRGTHAIEPLTLSLSQYASDSEWKRIWSGVMSAGSIHDHEWTDTATSSLEHLDLSRIQLLDVATYHEKYLAPRERISRLKEMKVPRLGARAFIGLWRNKDKIPRHWENYQEDPVEWRRIVGDGYTPHICFEGTVFLVPTAKLHNNLAQGLTPCVIGMRYRAGWAPDLSWTARLIELNEVTVAHHWSATYQL